MAIATDRDMGLRPVFADAIPPPSELRRPPSNAAATFLRYTAGNPNSNKLSSVMARAWRAPICC